MAKHKVDRLILDSYLSFIKNSLGTKMFKNFYAKVDGKNTDVMKDGWLSCALYVSGILSMFKLIKGMHGTIDATEKDLKESGWKKISKPKPGSIIIWEKINFGDKGIHGHIGFYIGNNQAISNNWKMKYPVKHHWNFNNKRRVDLILWNSKLK